MVIQKMSSMWGGAGGEPRRSSKHRPLKLE